MRTILAIAGGLALAFLGGLILGEYPFTGVLPIMGGAALGGAIGWVVNRSFGGVAPAWMAVVTAAIAAYGEIRAVQEDTPPGGDWPTVGWLAIAAAAAVAGYVVWSARTARPAREN
ncbi:MAG: hypothetical protein ACRDY7_11480 [Acidimicrobiia bacterium]